MADNIKQLSEIISDFCETTSGHGYYRIYKAKSRPIQKFIWTTLTLFAALCFLCHATFLGIRYSSYPLTSNQRLLSQEFNFPEVTICNVHALDIVRWNNLQIDPILKYREELSHLQSGNFSIDEENTWRRIMGVHGMYANMLPDEYSNLGHQKEDMVKHCVYGGKPCDLSHWKLIPDPNLINCYALKSRDGGLTYREKSLSFTAYIQAADVSSQSHLSTNYQIGSAEGLRVFIHPPGTAARKKYAMNFPPGISVTIPISISKSTRPSYPYTDCIQAKPLMAMKETLNYSYSGCSSLCQQEHVQRKCNCSTVHELIPDKEDPGMCLKVRNNDLESTFRRMECDDQGNIEASKLDTEEACGCKRLCENWSYATTPSTILWPSKSSTIDFLEKYVLSTNIENVLEDEVGPVPPDLVSFNKSTKIPKEHLPYLRKANEWLKQHFLRISIFMKEPQPIEFRYQPAYGLQEVLSDLGGALGLWMGFSILTIIELCEFIPHLFWKLRFIYTLNVTKTLTSPVVPTSTVTSASKIYHTDGSSKR